MQASIKRECAAPLVTRTRRVCRLDQKDVHFGARHGPVLDALRNNKDLAGIEDDRAIPQLDVERTLQHKKKIVGVVMLMPMERPLRFPWLW